MNGGKGVCAAAAERPDAKSRHLVAVRSAQLRFAAGDITRALRAERAFAALASPSTDLRPKAGGKRTTKKYFKIISKIIPAFNLCPHLCYHEREIDKHRYHNFGGDAPGRNPSRPVGQGSADKRRFCQRHHFPLRRKVSCRSLRRTWPSSPDWRISLGWSIWPLRTRKTHGDCIPKWPRHNFFSTAITNTHVMTCHLPPLPPGLFRFGLSRHDQTPPPTGTPKATPSEPADENLLNACAASEKQNPSLSGSAFENLPSAGPNARPLKRRGLNGSRQSVRRAIDFARRNRDRFRQPSHPLPLISIHTDGLLSFGSLDLSSGFVTPNSLPTGVYSQPSCSSLPLQNP